MFFIYKKNVALKTIIYYFLLFFLFSACGVRINGSAKKWLEWSVVFKENISQEEKDKAITSLGQYLQNSIARNNSTKVVIPIKSLVNERNKFVYQLYIPDNIGENVSMGSVTRHPPPPPPPIMPPPVSLIIDNLAY